MADIGSSGASILAIFGVKSICCWLLGRSSRILISQFQNWGRQSRWMSRNVRCILASFGWLWNQNFAI